jgi:hypothetical protein
LAWTLGIGQSQRAGGSTMLLLSAIVDTRHSTRSGNQMNPKMDPLGWYEPIAASLAGTTLRVVEREEVRSIAYLVGQDGSLLVSSAATPHQSNPKPIACVNESLGCVFEYSNQHGEKGLSPGNCGRPSSQGQTKYLMKHNSTWDYHGMNENGFELLSSRLCRRRRGQIGNGSGFIDLGS